MEEKPQEKIARSVETLISENRIIDFSDAVFAFAATLLVLKIDLPNLTPTELTSARLAQELFNLWPSYLANIISFLIIGYYWLNHHAIFSLIKKFDQTIIWLNIVFLIFLSFLPFPVDLFGEYSNSNIIVAFYCLSLSIVGFLLVLIWLYASFNHQSIEKDLSRHHILYYSLRFSLAPLVFAFSIPLAFIDPMIAKISWVFVIIGIVVVNKSFRLKKPSAIEKESV